MFFKDTLRLIKKTFHRFFSLVMIVLIGTAFMMGLMATSTIMRISVDQYNDDSNLQDIQLYSSYGFDQKDVDGLKQVEFVEQVFPSRMVDVYCQRPDGTVVVARVEEANRTINQYQLVQGRNPQKADEVVVLANSLTNTSLKLGDQLQLFLEDDDLAEKLSCQQFTIVGFANASAYTSKVLSTSNLANKDLNIIIYAPNENFIFDYYTTVYLTIEGSKDQLSYTDDYYDYVSEHMDDLEGYCNRQQDVLKEELLAKYTEEIQENEELLNQKKEEGLQQLQQAKDQLDEAKIKLIYGETAIETNKATLDASNKQVKENEKLLEQSQKEIDQALNEIQEQTGQDFDTVYQEVQAAYTIYIGIEMQIEQGGIGGNETVQKQIEELTKEKQANLLRIQQIEEVELPEIEAQIQQINQQIAQLDPTNEEDQKLIEQLNQQLVELNNQKTELETERNRLKTRNAAIDQMIAILSDEDSSQTQALQQVLDTLDRQFIEYGFEGVKDAYQQLTLLKNGIDQLEAGKAQLQSAKKQIEEGYRQIEEAQKTININKRKYEDGLKEYMEQSILFNEEIEKAENEIKKAYQDLAELPEAKWMVLDRHMHYSSLMYDNTCTQMGAIGFSLPFLFYLVAGLVCMTTMTRLIDEQRGQIGVFRALGFSKNQIIGKYLQYALFASIIGAVIGIGVGIFTFPVVIYETWKLMYYLPERKIVAPIWIVIVCVLAFAVLMMVVTYFVVKKNLQEVPAQLLRPKAPKNAKAIFLEKVDFIWKRLSFTGKITMRNLIRYKTRFFMTVIGVAGCTALLVVGFGVKDSIGDIIEIQFREIFNYNYNINLSNDHEVDEIVAEANKNLDNEAVVPYMQYMSKVYGTAKEETFNAVVIDARESADVFGFRAASDKKTTIRLNNNGVLVSEKFAKNNGIKKGDIIIIESAAGLKAEAKVSEICEMYFQHYIFISEDYYNSIFDQNVHYSVVAVKTSDEASLDQLVEKYDSIVSKTDFSSMVNQFETMIEALDLIIIVIIFTAGALALVVLVNLTQVNVSERTREIATLKVLGFNNREVNLYVFKEILMLSVIGGLCGLPLGVVFHHFIMNTINMEMVMFGMNIRFGSFAYSFMITIIFTVTVLFFTRKLLRNIEMVESLKSVE